VRSAQTGIEPRTGRGFALEWPKVGGGQAAVSGTVFKGTSRHNSGEGDKALVGVITAHDVLRRLRPE
jgi:hypothetical protein